MTQILPLIVAGALSVAAAEPPSTTAPGPASAEDAQAAADEDTAGGRHFRAGHFAEAAALYASAHARDPRPIYLYHWAQAERRAGNCSVAAQLYRRYLQYDVGPDNELAAKKNLARCGYADEPERSADGGVPSPPAHAEGTSPTPIDTPPSTADSRRAWLRDPAGITLVALGGAGLVASAVLGGGSSVEIRRAHDSTVEEDYARHADRSRTLKIGAIATGTIGGALVIAGVVRWLLVRRKLGHAPPRGTARLVVRF